MSIKKRKTTKRKEELMRKEKCKLLWQKLTLRMNNPNGIGDQGGEMWNFSVHQLKEAC